MEIGERIKGLRYARRMTLEQVGNICGVGKSTVRKWEVGQIKNMGHENLAKLAQALGTTPSYLIGWDQENKEAAPEDGRDIIFAQLFNELTPDEQREVIRYAEYLTGKR